MAIQDIDLGTILENGEDGDVARTAFTKVNSNFDDLDTRVSALESLDIGTVTSVNDVLPVDGNVELTPADIGAATAAQGAKADTAIQPSIFIPALDSKVDKVVGYQLSQEDFTTALKTKLEGLDDAGFQGFYVDLASLQSSVPVGQDGWWAFIDVNNVTPISIAVWSESLTEWEERPGGGGGGTMTPEEIKIAYESNPDTNAFTDAEKSKLGGIEAGAQVNVATNISQGVRTGTSVSINSSTGTGAILTGASGTEAGVMVASDKTKLDGIEAGAQANVATNLAQGTRTSTTVQVTSSTGTSATISSATTTLAGLQSAADKSKLDSLPSDFPATVRGTILTGLSTSTSTPVVATDTVLSAFGKLQARSAASLPAAAGTNGTTDFNDLTSAGWQPQIYGAAAGSRNANHPNGQTAPAAGNGVVNFYWVENITFSTNLMQVAWPYLSGADTTLARPYYRHRVAGGVWTSWVAMPRQSTFGAAQFTGIAAGSASGAVGNTWKKVVPDVSDFDTIGGVLLSDGLLQLPGPGLYELSCQIYPSPPASPSAAISFYLGLQNNGTDGSGSSLVRVANEEFPGGQHPSVSLTTMVSPTEATRYSFNWYFLDGASVTPTLDLQTNSTYSHISVKKFT